MARAGGVLERAGHTEAAVDIARLAGLNPSGVICEIMSQNGEMARLGELQNFRKAWLKNRINCGFNCLSSASRYGSAYARNSNPLTTWWGV